MGHPPRRHGVVGVPSGELPLAPGRLMTATFSSPPKGGHYVTSANHEVHEAIEEHEGSLGSFFVPFDHFVRFVVSSSNARTASLNTRPRSA